MITSTKHELLVCKIAGMDTCDLCPLRKRPWAKRLKLARRRCVSTPRAASGSCPCSDGERRGCSDHQRRTNRGGIELLEDRQLVGRSNRADSVTHLQRACTWLSVLACGFERSSLEGPA